jgi:stage IV sporulation protein B
VEDDKIVKRKSILIITGLLFCAFISMNPRFAQFIEFSELSQTQVSQQYFQYNGLWSQLIRVEKSNHAVSVASGLTNEPETFEVTYKLFGIFPLKSGQVQVMKPMELLPGGQSIGVSLQTKGVLVVGQAPIVDKNGKKVFPAKEAGIEIGDTILKIDNKEVLTDQDVSNALNQAGERKGNASVIFKHQGRILEKILKPVFCMETGRYRVGLFVRDEAAGVGTLSYFDPKSNQYGALGHVITDADTNQRIEVNNGKIMASSIYAIEKGKRGHPGEKLGSFVSNSPFSGTIEKNTITGIFGKVKGQVTNPYFKEPIPVGWESDIKIGPAKIYTVVQGDKIEEFNINIDRVMHNRIDSKNMIVRVTDPRLLNITGGIIQGMSGSPIVQDGKLIGAVTHVFVNDASRGYGVFIQNMLNEGFDQSENAA